MSFNALVCKYNYIIRVMTDHDELLSFIKVVQPSEA